MNVLATARVFDNAVTQRCQFFYRIWSVLDWNTCTTRQEQVN